MFGIYICASYIYRSRTKIILLDK